jgi:hypothetical protein
MMTKLFSQESVDPDPYVNTWMYLFDFLFVFRTIQLMYAESKELIPAAQNGLDGIIDYMEFWNAIDWISIISGLVSAGLWLNLLMDVNSMNEQVLELPMSAAHDRFYHFEKNTTWLSEEDLMMTFDEGQTAYEAQLDGILDGMGVLTSQVGDIRKSMSLFTFVMMFRFFKAFRANPRLAIATNTLSGAAIDIVHFGVVFIVIFYSFALIGHISFGHLHPGFRDTYYMSITCWDILMGDFDTMGLVAVDSQMGPLWNLGFMGIVLLILLNMLLAIIFDTYGEVKSKQGSDVLTIWAQAYHTYHQINEQRGFVATWPIICEFEDDDDPAHPEEIVTAESLRAAFTARDGINMSFAQATYMVEKAAEWVKAEFEKNQDSLSIENVLVSMAKMTGMVRRIQEKTWEKMSYIQDMNATTRQMLTFIPGVPNLPVMFGAGASPREQTLPVVHNRGNVFGGALNAVPGGMGMGGAPGMGAPGMGAPGMGAPGMGAPAMGAPAMGAGAPPMNMQPGQPMMGQQPFGASPNTTMNTMMNTSTMSTTAPAHTTMMVSNNTMGSTGSGHDGAISPHKSSNKHDAPFGSAEIRDEIKGWATTGSQIGKHALEKLENVERRVRIIEKGVERTTDALARGSRDELLERVLAEVEEMKKSVTSITEVQKQQMRLLQDVVARTRVLEKNQGTQGEELQNILMAAQSAARASAPPAAAEEAEESDVDPNTRTAQPGQLGADRGDGVVATSSKNGSRRLLGAPPA